MTKTLYTYCFKCKGKREILDPIEGVTKNNRKKYAGRCEECDGKIVLMGGYAELPGIEYDSQ
jgi:predicted SprT family Zn-dependent metalloprotease